MKTMLEKDLLNGRQMTVTGKTLEENLLEYEDYPDDQKIVSNFDNPIKPDSHLRICMAIWPHKVRLQKSLEKKD